MKTKVHAEQSQAPSGIAKAREGKGKGNMFLPEGLPLLADYVLIRSAVEYKQALSMLTGPISRRAAAVRDQMEQALHVIETELQARGIKLWAADAELHLSAAGGFSMRSLL